MLRLALLAACLLATPAAAQEQRGDPAKAIASYERYLERKPFHDWAFDKLVEAAVQINALGELVASYEERLAAAPDDVGVRVVLARLQARADQHDAAVATLAGIDEESAALSKLLGRLELERGRTAEAIAALDRAAELSEDRDELEAIHQLRGQARLAAGDRAGAHAAFRALAELEPENFNLRLEAAEALAQHGLHAEALAEFEVAESLAGDDVPRRCRVLSEIGRLHEALSQGEEALAVYRRALGLMARGNWLKRDLYDRVLSLHRRTGQLEALLERAAADAAASRQDLDAREFHARVLVEIGRRDGARAVLEEATREFPGDLALSRSLIAVLRDLQDADAVIAEYQRILTERPEELELYLELGRAFAAEGRFEQAKRQWSQSLEQRLTDPGLCVRLAELYALYDQPDDAVEMYRKAIDLQPADLRHVQDLAAYLRSHERAAEVPPLLEGAGEHAAGHAGRLEELSALWREHGDLGRARGALAAALELAPDDPRLLDRRAELELEAGEVEAAADTLHRVINLARESNLRRGAVDRLLRIFQRDDRLEELIAVERAALDAGGADPAPFLVLGRAYQHERRPEEAIAVLARLVALDPDSEDARLSLARLHEQQGDWDLALAEYEALMERRPATRRRYLEAVAQIHLARYDQEAAFACYEEILASAPDNPAAFLEVARAYERLGMLDESLDCLRQAVRLDPADGRTRLRLAEGYRALGEVARAEREILAAVEDDDEGVRADARQTYYDLLAAGGRVEDEIDALRVRIEANPYDVAAPLTLTDIYVRELEYQLALDMLEKLLTYQPNQARLLRERARMLALMDRHDEAIADYERLWRLPDADRAELSIAIADAALEQGDRARAAQVLSNVGDVRRVAALYRRKELWGEAIAAVERGLSDSPEDLRLLGELARMHEERGDEQAAIAVLERVLDARPDSWRTIRRLGALVHSVGDEERTVELGRRLFALIRVEDQAAEDEDEDDAPSTARRANTSLASWTSSRVYDIQSYFNEKNLDRQFAEIGAEEVLLQPTNYTLYQVVISALQRQENMGERCAAVIEAVCEAAERTGRVAETTTLRAFLRGLDVQRIWAYRSDDAFAEVQAARLEEEVAGGGAGPEVHLELAGIRSVLRQSEPLLAALEAGVAAHPDSANLLTGLALTLVEEKRYADALPVFERLVAVLEGEPPDEEAAIAREKSRRAWRQRTLTGFPVHVRRRISDEDLRRFEELTDARLYSLPWGLGQVQHVDGARLSYAHCLGKAGRAEEARAVLAGLAQDEDDSLRDLITVANAYDELDLLEEARALYERLAALEAELSADPVFGFNRSWERYFDEPMRRLARIHEKAGEPVRAYDLLRTYGDAAAGELVLTSAGGVEQATATYTERVAAEAAALEQAGPGADRRAWRDACVRLAEVHQIAKRWDEALAVYREVEAACPDDFAVRSVVARLHERAGRWDEAVAAHWRAVERKRELNQRPYRPERPPGRELTPVPPRLAQEEDRAWTNLLRNLRYSTGQGSQRFDYREDYVRILKIELDQGQVTRAAELLRELGRQDARTFSWIGYYLADVVEQYRLGPAAIPILRTVHAQNPGNHNTTLQYGRALVAGRKPDEARRVLTQLRDAAGASSYYSRQADQLLASLETREGVEREDTEALASTVEADPKSVKARMKLAQRLLSERRFAEALVHAREARALAPHKDDVAIFLRHCLQLNGEDEELEALLAEAVDDIEDDRQRLEAAARVADWMWERGERDAVAALFERAEARSVRRYPNYSSASWYAEKGELERARDAVLAALERTEARYRPRLRPALAAIQLALGDPFAHLDAVWQESYEEASALGVKSGLLTELATPLRGSALVEREGARLVERCAERGGLQGALYAAAVEVAAGDLAAAEARLAAVADPEGETRFLYPNLVSLARARGDLEAALGWLEELLARGVGSESASVSTAVGSLSERDALRAEVGGLRLALGDREGAFAVWDEMFDPDDTAALQRKARLLEGHGLHAEAAELMRRYLDEEGERDARELAFLAELELQSGHPAAAIELWRKAIVLAGEDDYSLEEYRSRLLDAHRAAGSLGELVADLEERMAADPDDVEAKKLLVRMYAEDGREDAALELLEGMLDHPSMSEGVLPTLIQRALVSGDEELAVARYRRLLADNMQEYERRRHSGAFASLLLQRGAVDEAIEVLREGYTDPDGADAHADIAGRLDTAGHDDLALQYWERAAELDPDSEYYSSRITGLLVGRGSFQEARDRLLAYLEDPARRRAAGQLLGSYRRICDETDEAERLARALAEDPGDPTTRLLAAVEAETSDREGGLEEAIGHYLTLLEGDPEDQVVLLRLRDAYVREERWADALAITERLLPLVDREQGVPGLSSVSYVSRLRDERAEYHLRMGDVEGAEACLRDRLGLRYASVRAGTYNLGSFPPPVPREVLDLYRRLEDWDRILELSGEAAAVANPDPDRQDGALYEARFRAGEREAVLEELWTLVEDPGLALFGERTSFTFYGTAENLMQNSSPLALLVRLHLENGTIDELGRRLEAALERAPEDAQLLDLERIVLELGEEWERLLARAERELEQDPFHPERLLETARLYARLGRHAEAVPLLERSRAIYRGQSYDEVTGWTYHDRMNPFAQTQGVRFSFSMGNTSRSSGGRGWSSYGISTPGWGGPADVVRRELIVAYHATGRRDEALALERREDAGRRAEGLTSRGLPQEALISLLREAGLYEEAERRRLAELERELAEVQVELRGDEDREQAEERAETDRRNLRGEAWRELAEMWLASEELDRAGAYVTRLLEQSDARLARIEADPELDEEQRQRSVAWWHRWRAELLAELAGDLEAARRELALFFEGIGPDADFDQNLQLAWLHLRLGQVEEARAIFLAVKGERSYGRWYGRGDLDYGLGLCAAAEGDRATAEPLLRRALASAPRSEHAREARAALE